MERCLEIVDVARPKSSVIWQTHNSPRLNVRRILTRFGSDNAFVMAINSRMLLLHFAKQRNDYDNDTPGWQETFYFPYFPCPATHDTLSA